jgi:hypothetical protein
MMIAAPEGKWIVFQKMSTQELAAVLKMLSKPLCQERKKGWAQKSSKRTVCPGAPAKRALQVIKTA